MPYPPEPPQQFVLTAEQLQQLLAQLAAAVARERGRKTQNRWIWLKF